MVKFVVSFAITVTILIILSTIFLIRDNNLVSEVSTFEECSSYGFPVIDSYPRQCHTPGGGVFYEKIKRDTNDKSDLIVVDFSSFNPDFIESPLIIKGKARGPWFFEADFPVFLYDVKNNLITTSIATAEGDWMTEEFVNFSTTLTFDKPDTKSGTLVLEKSNPSGLPENKDSLEIFVKFTAPTISDCISTGCSGQLCAEEDIITTCEFLPQYACFEQAVCERQVSGSCGWTETTEFKECLASIP
jgi:eight-cysteine-cluster-containing protein